MEKCGKLWRSEHGTSDRRAVQAAVYTIDGAGWTTEMRACSACAGDYEDPDRKAWTPDDAEAEEREGARRATTEEFPAED